MAEPLSRKDELIRWQGRVKVARHYQEKVGNTMPEGGENNTQRRWTQNINALAGDFNSVNELGDEAIDVNMIRSSAKTKLPPLKLVRPKITVNPTTLRYKGIDNVIAAENTGTEINYWFRELKVRRQVGKVLIDSQSTNCGYIYMGMVDKKEDAYDSSGDTRREFMPEVRHKQPFVKRHDPRMVLVPPGYWDLEECPWVDIVFNKPLMHVAEKFGIDPDDITSTSRLDLGFDESDPVLLQHIESKDVEMVQVHNVWDKETKRVYIFAMDMEDYLEEPKEWPWEVEGFPLVHYRPEDISDQYYGTPPTTYVMPQQKELNAARTALRKRFNRSKAVIFAGSDIQDPVIEEYKRAQDGAIIKTGMDDDIRGKLMIDPGLPIDAHSLQYGQMIKSDVIEIDQQSAEQRGGGDPNVDSATASANIQRNANIRSSELADGVRTMYLEIAKKMWMMISRGPNISVVRRIEGPIAGAFSEVKYSTKELRGEFNFDMDFSAKVPDTDAEKIQKSMLRYNLFRADPLVNPKELILDVYKAQGELNPEAKLQFLRSPDEEHRMFMQGLQAEAHERDNHQAHVQAHDAFVDQIDQALEQAQQQTGQQAEVIAQRLQVAQILMATHLGDHRRQMERIAGPGAKTQQPVSENSARAGLKSVGNAETEAELEGNPLGPVN